MLLGPAQKRAADGGTSLLLLRPSIELTAPRSRRNDLQSDQLAAAADGARGLPRGHHQGSSGPG